MAECTAYIGFKENGQWRETSTNPGKTGGPIALPATMRIRVEGCEEIESVNLFSHFGNTVVLPSQFKRTPNGFVAEIDFDSGGARPELHIFTVTVQVHCIDCTCYATRNMYVVQGKAAEIISLVRQLKLIEKDQRQYRNWGLFFSFWAIIAAFIAALAGLGVISVPFAILLALLVALLTLLAFICGLGASMFGALGDLVRERIKDIIRELRRRVPEKDLRRVLKDLRESLETEAQRNVFDEALGDVGLSLLP